MFRLLWAIIAALSSGFRSRRVRPDPEQEGHFILVVGERRWRAAQRAGLQSLLCISRSEEPRLVPARQWSENHYRVDLSPIEEAGGLKAIMEMEGLDAAAAAARYGVSERTIRRYLQLLTAPVWIQAAVGKGEELDAGDGTKELRRLDLTAAVELQRIYNAYVRTEESAAKAAGRGDEADLAGAAARAQRKAEAVKDRAFAENWSRRRWQEFAAAASRSVPVHARVQPSPSLFQSTDRQLTVRLDRVEASSPQELGRLADTLRTLLDEVTRRLARAPKVKEVA